MPPPDGRGRRRGTSQDGPPAGFLALAERLEARAEELAKRQAVAVRAEFPSYQGDQVPEAPLIRSALRNVQRVVTTLRQGRAPTPAEVHEGWVVRERTEQGVPSHEQLAAYRLCQRVLGDAVIEEAAGAGVDDATVSRATRLLWEMTDRASERLMVDQHAVALEVARYDEVQRLEFLRSVLNGTAGPADLHSRAPVYGLVLDQPYFAVRARASEPAEHDRVKRAIERGGRLHGLPVLAGIVDGDVAAVAPARPDLDGMAATAGVGGPATLEAMEVAFSTASRMLSVACQFGSSGTFGLGELSVRVAIASEPELGSMLLDRYIRPLTTEGDFGDLLEATVREFVASGQRILETAKRLHIHPNTLRHRLDRYQRLTGTDLGQPMAVVEVWWALEYRALERQSRA